MQAVLNKFRNLIGKIDISFVRFLDQSINWKARAICIEGARGTGKSTLMFQHIKRNLPIDRTLYVSLDDLYFRQHSLVNLAEEFYSQGGRYFYLDEVHKYPDGQSAVKNIYDFYPGETQAIIIYSINVSAF